jgi:hydrogenase maturation factor
VNLIYGEIVEVFPGPEPRRGKIRIGGAMRIISLDLLTAPLPGDKVLVCDGVALGKVDDDAFKENDYVSGHTR